MKKDDLLRLAKDERFISGIYNYCDRWCERCPFTGRCLNFAMSKEQYPDQEGLDMNNEAFWQGLSETFQVTLELIQDLSEREGIDLDALNDEAETEQRVLDEEAARNHKCCRMGTAYAEMMDNWFDGVKALSGEEGRGEEADMEAATPGGDPLGLKASCEEALEVIRWYQHQIAIKLMRAVESRMREEELSLDGFAKDSDGSAKVALVGIERSIGAWGELRGILHEHNTEIGRILLHLEVLRRNVEATFPDARDFIRPGFDKVDLHS
jgi:hypothetical protein